MAVKHSTTATLADEPGAEVNKAQWNADHTVDNNTLVAAKLAASATDVAFGRSTAGAGAGEEFPFTSKARQVSAAATALAMAAILGVPYIQAKSGVAVSCPADTTEDTLATINIPILTANAVIRVRACFTSTNSANNKTFRVRFSGAAGTIIATRINTTQIVCMFDILISNRNATNSQISYPLIANGGGAVLGASAATAVDTTVATTIVITGQKTSAGETLTLDSYVCEVLSDGT